MRRAWTGALVGLVVAAPPARAWFESSEVGARAFGLGGAFVSVADDASAVYWNPAGLVRLQRHELLLSVDHTPELPEHSSSFAAGALNHSQFVLGVGWRRVALADAASEDLWSLSVAAAPVKRSLGAFLAGGATVKLARVGIETGNLSALAGVESSAWGVAADVGLLIAPIPNVFLGGTWRNLGEPRFDLVAGGSSTRLEREIEWGASLRWWRDGWLNFGQVRRAGTTTTRAGGELRVAGALGVRMGVERDAVSGGADFRFGRYTLDTSYRAHETLGATYKVGLRMGFGKPRTGLGGEYDEF